MTAAGAPAARQTGTVMRCSALGRGVQERFARIPCESGRVHSVFAQALNVVWPDGRLLALHAPGMLRAPFAAVVERLPGQVRAGAPVRREGSHLWMGGPREEPTPAGPLVLGRARGEGEHDPVTLNLATGEPSCIEVAMEGARVVDTRMPPAPDRGAPPWFGEIPGEGIAPSLGTRPARLAQRRLADGIRHRDGTAFLQAAAALIGLGEGLTPAGDDFLVGVLAALFRFVPAWIPDAGVAARLQAQAENGTTAIAREFLRYALAGAFSEPVLRVVTASTRLDAHTAQRALAAVGASSGADTLAGIRLGVEALQPSSTLMEVEA
jgi:hypothetical protein